MREIASSIGQSGKQFQYIIHWVYDQNYTKMEADPDDVITVGPLVDSIDEAMRLANIVLDTIEEENLN